MTAVSIRFAGRVLLGGYPLRCPGRGPGSLPRHLTLIPTGASVSATCGEKHRGPDHTDKKANCWWTVEGITAAQLTALAEVKPGYTRAQLAGGVVLEGRIARPKKERTGLFGSKKQATKGTTAKTAAASAKPANAKGRKSGGTAAAAFGTLTAAFQAVGQTAGSVSAIASTASTVAKETGATARTGMNVANNTAARRFAALNATKSSNDTKKEAKK